MSLGTACVANMLAVLIMHDVCIQACCVYFVVCAYLCKNSLFVKSLHQPEHTCGIYIMEFKKLIDASMLIILAIGR